MPGAINKLFMESDVTKILKAIKAGRDDATDKLLPIDVYNELRELATKNFSMKLPVIRFSRLHWFTKPT